MVFVDQALFVVVFLSVLLTSIISLIGVFVLWFKKEQLHTFILLSVSFATGALLGDALFHLIPDSFEEIGDFTVTSIFVSIGILLFFAIEKFLRWRHCHVHDKKQVNYHPMGFLSLIGDLVHNFFDGIAIAASYVVDINLGIATTIAVILHEIPQEISDTSILLFSGYKLKEALKLNFIVSLSAFLGMLFGLFLINVEHINFIIAITAGGFIYVAGSDLIPELHERVKIKESVMQFIFILFGLLIMLILKIWGV
jgi:zinc and cadmium transporter